MKNQEIADILYEIADFLEIQEVEFKPRAYRRAARNVEALSEDIEDIHERDELEDIDGVGESIAGKIAEYLETGELSYYEELKAELPIDIEAITAVEGVGPKTAKALYRELGVSDLDDLEAAAREGRIAELEGFGEKSQANILDHIALARQGQERTLLGRAFPIARSLADRLSEDDAFDRVEVVGSFRRRLPTVGDLDVLATAPDAAAAMDAFTSHDDVIEVLGSGGTKSSVRVSGDLQIDLRIVQPDEWGAALIYFTGSKDHNIALRNRAIDRDWKLNEYGLFDVADVEDPDAGQRVGERVAAETEEAVYSALDLAWIPPEIREDLGEVEAAAGDALPDLVTLEDLRGDLQVHTTYSDGSASIEEMARAADALGHEYLLFTDHGPSFGFAGGLDRDRFDEQAEEIASAAGDVDVELLHGIEANVTATGLDVDVEWCEVCDLVVAALHARPADPTEQIVRALEDYPVDVLAHPTNRLINEREPLELDLPVVVEAAAENRVALEINAQPQRLDLDWAHVREFRDAVRFTVSTDAHSTGGLEALHLGVSQARRGWLESDHVLNTRPLDALLEWCHG